jgi:hypothetical protein
MLCYLLIRADKVVGAFFTSSNLKRNYNFRASEVTKLNEIAILDFNYSNPKRSHRSSILKEEELYNLEKISDLTRSIFHFCKKFSKKHEANEELYF